MGALMRALQAGQRVRMTVCMTRPLPGRATEAIYHGTDETPVRRRCKRDEQGPGATLALDAPAPVPPPVRPPLAVLLPDSPTVPRPSAGDGKSPWKGAAAGRFGASSCTASTCSRPDLTTPPGAGLGKLASSTDRPSYFCAGVGPSWRGAVAGLIPRGLQQLKKTLASLDEP